MEENKDEANWAPTANATRLFPILNMDFHGDDTTQCIPMIPRLFLPLNRIPMSITGKVNRRLLRDVASALSRGDLKAYSMNEVQKRPPSSLEESVIQKAVSDILRLPVEDVGMADNFFRLGGDSIAAMNVVSSVRESAFFLTVADVFSHPRLEDLAAVLEGDAQSSTSRKILPFALLEEVQRFHTIRTTAIQCETEVKMIEDIYPCTPMQEALMALSMKQQGQYVAEMTFDVREHLGIDRIKSAWEAVYEANQILRTRIVSSASGGGASLQVVIREPLRWSSDRNPLAVENGRPLGKVSIRQEAGHWKLRVWLHHALYDGTSLPLLLEQAEAAYHGHALSPRPFHMFAAYIKTLDLSTSKDFWKTEFRDLNATMFPAMRSRAISAHRASVSHNIPIHDMQGLEFTLPCIIHSACATTLGHYANSEDIVHGLTLAGRNAPVQGIRNLVGPTIATVPFRVRLSPTETMRELLSDIQSHLVRIIPHEQTGLQIIRSINSECAAACDFHCHLVIQLPGQDERNDVFKEPTISNDVSSQFSSSPLVLIFTVSADRRSVLLVANFDVSYLETAEVMNFAWHLDHVVQEVIRDATALVQDVQVAGPRDLLRLENCNASTQPRRDRLIHDLVTDQCYLRPAERAICSWDGSLTYGQLDDTSSRLAQHLVAYGVGRNPVTALCMEKSRWTIVALLSVFKAGSACTVLDTSLPKGRMQDVLIQTGATFVIASPATLKVAETIAADTTVITVSSDLLYSPPPSRAQNPTAKSSTDPALIVFTSGSTGKPKGIVLEHANIATALRDLCEPLRLDENSRVLHFSSYAFDASFLEVFGCLTSGGCLCIPSESDRTSNLCKFMESYRANWAQMIPSTAHILDPSCVPSLTTLAMTGEALKLTDVHRWAAKKHLSLLNVYGPAESTFACAIGQVSPTEWTPGMVGPIVSGIGWIANPHNPAQLCAWGAVGELLIEGPILVRGYIGDQENTVASFIPSPSWLSRIRGHKRCRLYRTGDLVQYTSNGQIRYIGRKDRQLKLNGQHIEPEEIETNLAQYLPKDAIIIIDLVVPQSRNARPRLFAFIHLGQMELDVSIKAEAVEKTVFATPDEDFLALCRTAKERLSESLPRYMIPETFIQLNYVPRTNTGKINHRLLLEAAGSLHEADLDRPSYLCSVRDPGLLTRRNSSWLNCGQRPWIATREHHHK